MIGRGGEKDEPQDIQAAPGRGAAQNNFLNRLQKLPNGGQTEGDSRRSDGGEERLAVCKTDGPCLNRGRPQYDSDHGTRRQSVT